MEEKGSRVVCAVGEGRGAVRRGDTFNRGV